MPGSNPPPPARVRQIGLIGCGRMGSAIAGHLLARGWPVTATDPDESARARAVALGAHATPDAAAVAADSDLTLVVVVDDEQVRSAIAGRDGALTRAKPGSILAVCASIRPDTCRDLALIGDRSGVHVIDAALVRGERGAEAGRLALMCGGPAEVIDACRPAFSAFASDVCRLGEVGSGQVAKVVNNILLWSCLRADYEALRLGEALGVDLSALRDAVALGSGANRPLEEWGNHRLRWPGKDLELARGLAREAGVDTPLVDSLGPLLDGLTPEDLWALV